MEHCRHKEKYGCVGVCKCEYAYEHDRCKSARSSGSKCICYDNSELQKFAFSNEKAYCTHKDACPYEDHLYRYDCCTFRAFGGSACVCHAIQKFLEKPSITESEKKLLFHYLNQLQQFGGSEPYEICELAAISEQLLLTPVE